jgi:hypothetical protein
MTKKLLLALGLSTFTLQSGETDIGITYGFHDMFVSNITPSSLHEGGTSHTLGVNTSFFIEHRTDNNIVFGGISEIYFDHDKDHLDPDHIPIWFKFNIYADGPLIRMTDNFNFMWHLNFQNKQNTTSGIEREIKNMYGFGLDYTPDSFHIALNAYAGFFYLEIDDDAPIQYSETQTKQYQRNDLGLGTSSISVKLESSWNMTNNFTILGHVQNWSSTGVGSGWLENEYVAEINYDTDGWIKRSKLHLRATHTQYNIDVFYRPDVGVPVLPWDNDTLVRAYMSIAWGI